MEGYLVYILLEGQILFNWRMIGRPVVLIVTTDLFPFPIRSEEIRNCLHTKEFSETVLHILVENISKSKLITTYKAQEIVRHGRNWHVPENMHDEYRIA